MALPSSSPLHAALFCHVAGKLKRLIYTFLHGVFKQIEKFKNQKRGLDEWKRFNFIL